MRKKIDEELSKSYTVDENKFSISNMDYTRLINDVKKYCIRYRTILVSTTIEGAIICKESYQVVMEWIKEFWGEEKKEEFEKELKVYSEIDRLSILRCIFHGKLDSLMNVTEDGKCNVNKDVKKIIDKYKSGDKTDGWVFQLFKWYTEKFLIESKEKNLEIFEKTFPELAAIVKSIKYML